MGSFVELNDTLQITTEQGFPKELVLEKHLKKPFTEKQFEGRIFEFYNKPSMRVYHPSPTRCFLVHNIGGKWLYWGHILMIEQTIHAESKTTSGHSFPENEPEHRKQDQNQKQNQHNLLFQEQFEKPFYCSRDQKQN